MHRLLRRQIARCFGDPDSVPDSMGSLLEAVSLAYRQADDDRALLERSLELTSAELMARNEELRADIVARRRVEAALQARTAQLEAVLAAISDAVLAIADDGVVLEYHAGNGGELPTSPTPVGRHVRDALPAAAADAVLAHLAQVVSAGGVADFSIRLPSADEPQDWEARMSRARGQSFCLVTLRNVTATRRMKERLLIADRMASVGTLCAGVAHEINNPLTFVMCNLDEVAVTLREHPGALPESVRQSLVEAVSDAFVGAQRVARIVGDLKTFSRFEGEESGSCDLAAVATSALRMAESEVRHRARLVTSFEPVPPVEGSESRLAQVVLNLVVNAAQAMELGRAKQNEIRVRIGRGANPTEVLLEVTDSGPGIPPEVVPRIFDPFFTTKPVGVGTGLGLSICHNIVRGLGGEITVESGPGRGACFRVRLPVARCVAPAVPDELAMARAARSGRVLVVDDEAIVTKVIARALRGCRVDVVNSGRQAIARLLADDDFDVVLCDVMMPDLTGMDVYDTVRACRPDLTDRFVFMTGDSFTDDVHRFLGSLQNPWLRKPFTATAVRALVASVAGAAQSVTPPPTPARGGSLSGCG